MIEEELDRRGLPMELKYVAASNLLSIPTQFPKQAQPVSGS